MKYLLSAILACCLFCGSGNAVAANYSLQPFFSLSEEITDNVNDDDVDKQSDFITTAKPGLVATYSTGLFDLKGDYSPEYLYYANGHKGGALRHNGGLDAKFRVIDERVFFDFSDQYKWESIDNVRDKSNQGSSTFTETNTVKVSPYVQINPSGRFNAKVGYEYADETYFKSSGIDQASHKFFVDPAYLLSPGVILSASLSSTRTSYADDHRESNTLASLGVDYSLPENSKLSVKLGNSWTKYSGGGIADTNSSSPYWDVNLSHGYGATKTSISSGITYDDSVTNAFTETWKTTVGMTRDLPRGSIGTTLVFIREKDRVSGSRLSNYVSFKLSGSYNFTEKLSASLKLLADRMVDYVSLDYYRHEYTGNAGLRYALNKMLDLTFDYYYSRWASPSGSSSPYCTNRLVVAANVKFGAASR